MLHSSIQLLYPLWRLTGSSQLLIKWGKVTTSRNRTSEVDNKEQHHLDAEKDNRANQNPELEAGKEKTGAQSGETGGSDGEGHPNPKKTKSNKPKKKRLPPFEPVHVPLEGRKFCIFHEVVEIPCNCLSS